MRIHDNYLTADLRKPERMGSEKISELKLLGNMVTGSLGVKCKRSLLCPAPHSTHTHIQAMPRRPRCPFFVNCHQEEKSLSISFCHHTKVASKGGHGRQLAQVCEHSSGWRPFSGFIHLLSWVDSSSLSVGGHKTMAT